MCFFFLFIPQHFSAFDRYTLHYVGYIRPFLFVLLILYLKVALYSYPQINISGRRVLICLSITSTFSLVAVPTLTFSFPLSIFSLFTATFLLTPQLHPCPVILLSISSPFFPLSLHHHCLSFRAQTAPVKLILPLC